MSKHVFRIIPMHNSLSRYFVCENCKDPEPETVDYVWIDTDGTVYFDSTDIDKLIIFIAHHDAFKLTEVRSEIPA